MRARGYEKVTKQKAEKCAKWLSYCLEIGWRKSDLPELQKLWMNGHDDKGNYIRTTLTPANKN